MSLPNPAFHASLHQLEPPVSGMAAERRDILHERALLKRGRTEPNHETAASR